MPVRLYSPCPFFHVLRGQKRAWLGRRKRRSLSYLSEKWTRESSTNAIITRGSLIYMDWGVHMMNFGNDMKRTSYVLKDGETQVPGGIQNAFNVALGIRKIIRTNIKPGRTGTEILDDLQSRVRAAGYEIMDIKSFGKPSSGSKTEVIIGCHSTGNTGHDIGASIVNWQPVRSSYVVGKNEFIVIEFFTWTPVPEWGGRKVEIPLEDDAIVTDQGAEWLVPPIREIGIIK
ncbi:MAG: M24 family metallopeptidase [Blastocatellia bacterium]